ncbi:MAG: LysM peptidoglycan-binding domain-containing protein [Vitreimonas sp.]
MVAIFVGLGAGFERGSRAALGSAGLLGSGVQGRNGEGVALNAANGNLILTQQDEFLAGLGPDVAVGRTYNSASVLDDNGDHWRQSTDRRVYGLTGSVNTAGSTITRVSADGSESVYTYNATLGFYTTTDGAGAYDKLVYTPAVTGPPAVGAYWTWTDGSSQYTETYLAADGGFISKYSDTDGNALTFTYSSAGKLDRITTANSEYVKYIWSNGGTGTDIVAIETHFGASSVITRATYSYDAQHRLTTVSVDLTPDNTADSVTYTTTYAYVGTTNYIYSINQSDGSWLIVGYDGANRVTSLTQYDGNDSLTSETQVLASGHTRRTEIAYGANQTSIKVYRQEYANASTPSDTTTLTYNALGQLTQATAPPAYAGATVQTVQYAYDTNGNVTQITDPAGAITRYVYDAWGNAVRITDANGNVTVRAYDVGADYTGYINNNADLLAFYNSTIASTGVSKADFGEQHWILYGAGEGRTLSATGGTNVLLRSGSVASTAAVANILVLSRYVYDSEDHLRFSISAQGVVTQYEYTGPGDVSRATSYAQDAYGVGAQIGGTGWLSGAVAPSLSDMTNWVATRSDKSAVAISVNTYDLRGDLASTTRYGAADASGAAINGEGYAQTLYVYNQAGQLVQRTQGPQASESFVYDGLGRLTASTDLNGGTTNVVFNDGATTTKVTTASGYTTISTYNKAGDLLNRTDTVSGQNANTTTGTDYFVYDKNGQVRQSTDATGKVHYFIYDKVGRKVADIGQNGEVIEYKYDVDDRLIASVRYTNALSSSELAVIAASSTAEFEFGVNLTRPSANSADLWSWTIYDAGGRIIETIAGDGAAIKYEYDASDRLIKTTSFVTKLSVSGFIATPPTTATYPTSNAADRITRSFYDGDGRLIGALNAEGYVSQIKYDSAGRKIQEITYANKPTGTPATDPFATILANITASAAADISTRLVYDGQGLLRFTIDALNHVTELVYRQSTDSYAIGLTRKSIQYATALGAVSNYNYGTIKSAVALIVSSSNDRVSYAVYNTKGQLACTLDATGAVVSFTYDVMGRVIKTTQYAALNTAGLASTADSSWLSTMDTWASGQASNTANRTTRTWYTERGDVRYVVDAEGYLTQNDYDPEGRLTVTHRYGDRPASGGTALSIDDTTTFDALKNADKGATDAAVSYYYDPMGRLSYSINSLGLFDYFGYYGNGEVACEIVGTWTDNARTYFYYDQAGHKTKEIRYTSQTFNAASVGPSAVQLNGGQELVSASGQYKLVLTLNGELQLYHKGELIWTNGVHDAAAYATYRLMAQTDGNLVVYRDVAGQSPVVIWSSNTAGSYSGAAFVVMQDDGNLVFAKGTAPTSQGTIWASATAGVVATNPQATESIETNYAYDGLGNVVSITDPNGAVTNFAYDKLGRILTRTDALGGVTTYQYDAFGNVIKTIDPRSNASTIAYDKANRIIEMVDAEGYHTRTTYTAFGEVASVVRFANKDIAPYTPTWAAGGGGLTLTQEPLDGGEATVARNGHGEVPTWDPNNAWGGDIAILNGDRSDGLMTVAAGDAVSFSFQGKSLAAGVTIYARLAFLLADGSYAYSPTLNISATTWQTFTVSCAAPANAIGMFLGVLSYRPDKAVNASFDFAMRDVNVTRTAGSTTTVKASGPSAADEITNFAYDKLGRLIQSTDAAGASESYGLSAFGQRVSVTNKLGGVTSYVYDRRGLLKSETLPVAAMRNDGSQQAASVTNTYAYDSRGNRIQMVEASGLTEQRTATYAYDLADRLTSVTGDAVQATSSAVSGATSVTPTTTYAYDTRGNVIKTSVTQSTGVIATSFSWYDKLNQLIEQVSPLGTVTRLFYDKAGNLTEKRIYATRITPPADALGAPSAVSGAYRSTQYAYDALGRVTQVKTPSVEIASYASSFGVATQDLITTSQYDAMGNVVKVTDPNGAVTWSYYDKLARKTTQIDALNYRTDWTYDSDGNVTSEKRYANAGTTPSSVTTPPSAPAADAANDRTTTFSHDKMGRRLTETRANVLINNSASPGTTTSVNATVTYTYNALGEVLTKAEATGDTTTYHYDTAGRMDWEKHQAFNDYTSVAGGAQHSVTPETDYFYDGLNDLVRTVQRDDATLASPVDHITRYSYGAGGRLASVTDAEGFVHAYSYDAAGRVTRDEYTRQLPSGTSHEAIGYDYDLEGRVIRQGVVLDAANTNSWSHAGAAVDTTSIKYNAFGEVSQRGLVHFSSGNTVSDEMLPESFDYDGAGRLWRTTSGDGTSKYFMYDAAGNQTLMVASTGTDISSGAGYSTIDAVLNLWGATRSAIGTNYVSGIVATITRYDARNQAIEVKEPQRELTTTTKSDLSTTRAYNAFGEVAYEINALSARVDYSYNTMGRLIQTQSPTVAVTSASGAVSNVHPTENYYYDASGRRVAARDANGNLTQYSLLAGSGYNGKDALIAQTKFADNNTITTGYDIFGNARKITDQIARIDTQSFDKMGRLTQLTHASSLIDYYQYDGLGQRIKNWNSQLGSGVAQTISYDAQGRITQTIAMGGDATNYAYAWDATIATTGLGTFGGWAKTTTMANFLTRTDKSDYFDHATYISDLGAHTTSFTYDKGARNTAQNANYSLTYYNTGRLASQVTTGVSAVEHTTSNTRTGAYTYDAAGDLLTEKVTEAGEAHWSYWIVDSEGYPEEVPVDKTWNGMTKNMTASYDALGRLTAWSDAAITNGAANGAYEYDANGNVRRSNATTHVMSNSNLSATTTAQDYWYTYDSLNRIVIAKGALSGGVIGRGATGVSIFYDGAGQRVYSYEAISGGQTRREDYTYDAGGRITQVNSADGSSPPSSAGAVRATYTYDAMGRTLTEANKNSSGSTVFSRTLTYNNKGQITHDSTSTVISSTTNRTETDYDYGSIGTNAANSSYALGAAVGVFTKNYSNNSWVKDNRVDNTYLWSDGPQLGVAITTPNLAYPSTTLEADYLYGYQGARAQLEYVDQKSASERYVEFTNDLNGQVTERREVNRDGNGMGPNEYWYRLGGKQLAYVGNNNTITTDYVASISNRTTSQGSGLYMNGASSATPVNDTDQGYDPINSYDSGSLASTDGYTVQSGDTLQSIASQLWGDSALWYKLAEVNGLTGDEALIEGTLLNVPPGVIRNTYNASTFTPYDPADIVGNTSPRGKSGAKNSNCGIIGQLFIAVLSFAISRQFGAIPGSIISQEVAVALGLQQKFSWNQVGIAAVAAVVGGNSVADGVGDGVANAFGATSGFMHAAIAAGVDTALTQGIAVATGMQNKFSWANVAASAIGAGVGFEAGRALNIQGFAQQFGRNSAQVLSASTGAALASDLANAATRSLIDGSDFGDNMLAAIPDVIGQMLSASMSGGHVDLDALESPTPLPPDDFDSLPTPTPLPPDSFESLPNLPLLGPDSLESITTPPRVRASNGWSWSSWVGEYAANNPENESPFAYGLNLWGDHPTTVREIQADAPNFGDYASTALSALRDGAVDWVGGIVTDLGRRGANMTLGFSLDEARLLGVDVPAGAPSFVGGMIDDFRSLQNLGRSISDFASSEQGQLFVRAEAGDFQAGAQLYANNAVGVASDFQRNSLGATYNYVYHGTQGGLTLGSMFVGGEAALGPEVAARSAEGLAGAAAPGARVLIGRARIPAVELANRLSPAEMAALQAEHGTEFAQIYLTGPGRNGGGGTYYLLQGTEGAVDIPLGPNVRLINHTHPEYLNGYEVPLLASDEDRAVLTGLQQYGSPQRTSQVVPQAGTPFSFTRHLSRVP